MALPNVFTPEVTQALILRISKLTATSVPQWGKMTVAQMLAHCCISYQYIYEETFKAPGFLMKWILKTFIKNKVVNEVPYPRNGRTAPDFIITDERNLDIERKRLVEYILQTLQLGKSYFEGKESHSFGSLTGDEWNNMLYKHLDHHLTQFGV